MLSSERGIVEIVIADQLSIGLSADALVLTQTILGNGVTIGMAALTGDAGALGTSSGADITLGMLPVQMLVSFCPQVKRLI